MDTFETYQEPEAKPCQNPSLSPFCSITATNTNPQWVIAVPANPLARPHLAEMPLIHPTLTQGITMPTVDTQLGQSSTDLFPCCYLTARPASTHWINSPSQICPSPTVQRALTLPKRGRRAVPCTSTLPSPTLHAHLHGTMLPT
jgi:hypothetical protein